MNIVAKSREQWQIWSASCQLSSGNEAERRQAIALLATLAPASLPALRAAALNQSETRAQFAAAIALHRCGEPLGLEVLSDNLRLHLPHRGVIAAELEASWMALDDAQAAAELLNVWNKAAYWSDENVTLALIGRVWARRGDPRVLDALAGRAASLPKIFDETITPFGEAALPALEKMTGDASPFVRILAVQTLKKIAGVNSLNLLAPLLRDPDAVTRAQVPQAMLKTGWPAEAVRHIGLALEAGFSSPEGVALMESVGPVNYDALIALVNRWNPDSRQISGDTAASVFAALRVLEKFSPDDAAALDALCGLLNRGITPSLTAETIRVVGVVAVRHGAPLGPLRAELLPCLANASDTVRGSAARTLAIFGVSLGEELERLIAETRPKDSLLAKFQSVLQGEIDAEAVADRAIQQVGGWLTRMTKDTAGRMAGSASVPSPATADSRMPHLLNALLRNALDALNAAQTGEETAERISLCVACLRIAARFPKAQAMALHDALIQALYCIKFGEVSGRTTGSAMRSGDVSEVGRFVRREAAAALTQIYGADAFPLFLAALYDSAPDIRRTAITALGSLGDARAMPHLVRCGRESGPLLADAQEAIARIRGLNPAMMTLLRGASSPGDARPETLLRPAQGGGSATPPDQLLRPAPSEPPGAK